MRKPTENAATGDYLFAADGGGMFVSGSAEEGSAESGAVCVGVVFSTRPADCDRARGAAGGCALAVRDAAAPCRWADEAAWSRRAFLWRRPPRCGRLPRPDNLLCRDGLRNSLLIGADADYPAFRAALGGVRGMRGGAARLFLPSAGQWLEILSSLADFRFAGADGASLSDGCWDAWGEGAAARLNGWFERAPGGQGLCGGGRDVFWSSTPAGGKAAYGLAFHGGEGLVGVYRLPASARCRVRAAIAF